MLRRKIGPDYYCHSKSRQLPNRQFIAFTVSARPESIPPKFADLMPLANPSPVHHVVAPRCCFGTRMNFPIVKMPLLTTVRPNSCFAAPMFHISQHSFFSSPSPVPERTLLKCELSDWARTILPAAVRDGGIAEVAIGVVVAEFGNVPLLMATPNKLFRLAVVKSPAFRFLSSTIVAFASDGGTARP